MSKNNRNIETINGPKITPMKPNNGIPATTPKIVINGCMFAIFFCNMNLIKLSL